MIILVAVTLNIALGENGLIAKAKETRTKQEEQTIYEDIQGMMELNDNGEIDVDKTVDNVKAKYPGTELYGTTLIVPGKYGTYNYEIKTTGIEIAEKTMPKDFDLEKYILGEDKQGRNTEEILGEAKFIDDPSTVDVDESTILLLGMTYESTEIIKDIDEQPAGVYSKINIYIKYNNEIYKFIVGYDSMMGEPEGMENTKTVSYSEKEGIKRIGESEEKEVVQLGGKNWIILNRNGDKVELISEETLNADGVTLGYNKQGSDTRTDEEKLNEAQISYNNAIEVLNEASMDAAKDVLIQIDGIEYSIADKKLKYTGIVDGETYEEEIKVRSVGSDPTNPTSENTNNFKVSDIPFKDGNDKITVTGANNKGKDTDYNYIYDYEKMIKLGMLNIINDTQKKDRNSFWFASRKVHISNNACWFCIRWFDPDGVLAISPIWSVPSNKKQFPLSDEAGVRPVISLSSKLLEQLKNS